MATPIQGSPDLNFSINVRLRGNDHALPIVLTLQDEKMKTINTIRHEILSRRNSLEITVPASTRTIKVQFASFEGTWKYPFRNKYFEMNVFEEIDFYEDQLSERLV